MWWGKNVLSVSRTFRKCRKIVYLEEIKTSTNLFTVYLRQIGSVFCNRKGYEIASKMVSQESNDVLQLPQPSYRRTRDKLAKTDFFFSFLVSFLVFIPSDLHDM